MMNTVKRYWRSSLAWVKSHRWQSATGALILLVILYMGFGSGGEAAAEVMVVEPQDFTAAVSVAGTVVASQNVDLGFAKSGRVAAVYAKPGARVTAGATLASMENGDVRAALLQRQAALQSARARLGAVTNGSGQDEISIARADVDAAREELVSTLLDAYRAADDAVRNSTAELFENPRTTASFKFAASNSRYNRPASQGRKDLEFILESWQSAQIGLSASSNLTSATALAKTNLAKVSEFLTNTNQALAAAEPEQGYATQAELSGYISDVSAARASIGAMQSSVNIDFAALTNAQKNLELKQTSSPEDVSIEQANVRAAEADVAAAQAELAKTLIVAPFAGTISQVDAKVGAIASANDPLISLLSSGSFLIESYVPEVAIAEVAVGDTAEITLDAYGASVPFKAKVVLIDPAETERDGIPTYKTTLEFSEPDTRIRSGMTANITVSTEHKAGALVIPQGALVRRGEERFVMVVVDGEPVERKVVVGLTSVGQVEIVSGLSAGESIVLNP